jgi:hypothetical membrane protein
MEARTSVAGDKRQHRWKGGGRSLALAGPAAAALFAFSLIGFAAARSDGYDHATKAVSELGAVGAANALLFNVAGFIVPGLLIIFLAVAFYRRTAGTAKLGPILLALSGLALTMAGSFPVDMEARLSAGSQLHLAGATLCGILWSAALFPIGAGMRRSGFPRWGRLTPWFGLFLVVNLGWQVQWQSVQWLLPGWGQRIGFFGYFAWAAVTGVLLAQPRKEVDPADPPAVEAA